ncbi:bifunctional fucokinase/fucose-1-phosphate guanylyltransferase [Aporhodopirellula aestuarii]|uniref:Bifunctional fucokinase/fucose-1-phosphate guanylyltransferase n=1 Tax=Aporhodopirellula aestuarii TaxID=2950107 RepID=A0ABT0U4Q4_9BACT|nr:bifunctional fucokinase/fucose-1-phosphate guanylyltransferase [Aporhodopirellula aestuarii]MCM2371917.1 bifunctional fucokinase/fucose-1-phosphate guanylyltransferase [Aporhodopirellula aestuarii]
MNESPQLLLSLPPNMCRQLPDVRPDLANRVFATHDPPEAQLGSGGGTAHVLAEAWRRSKNKPQRFRDWTDAQQRIVLHGGGESRRLPAYAGVGKLFIPVPVLRWSRGQRLGQTLLDLNEPFLREAFSQAGESARVMIASGDVMLRSREPIPKLSDVDVVLMGMWASPEVAQNYGVMFCDRDDPRKLKTFLQKPSPDEIRDRSREMSFLIDIGVWLLSERAVACLMSKCGWDVGRDAFAGGDVPKNYDLYGQWSQHFGSEPVAKDSEVSELSVAIAPVQGGEFYHFGTTNDVIESMYSLQNIVTDQSLLGAVSSLAQPKQFIQDSSFGGPLRRQENEALWVEGSHIPKTWKIGKRHMLTGVPTNDWQLDLADGVCLDFVPVGESGLAIRPYGYADRFRGELADESTMWLEQPAAKWFSDRNISWKEAGLDPSTDMQFARLFPLLETCAITSDFMKWLIAGTADSLGEDADAHREAWLAARRLSARELSQKSDLQRVQEIRSTRRRDALPVMVGHGRRSIFFKLDLANVAKDFAESNEPLPEASEAGNDVMLAVHDRMFRSEVMRCRNHNGWQAEERAALRLLEESIVSTYHRNPVVPQNQLANDQIVWARSPARVDFAGGWTDTPPYCIQQGGCVVNIALNLNGQPPIQAFARRSDDLSITIRSIDLGISEQLNTYEEVGNYCGLGSGFSVAKAALCLCGFHPDFNGGKFDSLADQLRSFGGGVDVSMLAAIPKGSGLGTSSILAGTVLGALSELAGYHWDAQAIANRVTAVEQMLGSGGGWQDQIGGLLPGAKLIETQPGMTQTAAIRWLPTAFFESPEYESRALLYYTGIARVAHDVLGEIVRGMFLNDPTRLGVLAGIERNSHTCFDAVQRLDLAKFGESIDRSWQHNQALDSGTNPPEVVEIVERIQSHTTAFKLSGAGGGGFMYMLAKDADHARRLREDLENNPPNERARFVDMRVSSTGLQVTRS